MNIHDINELIENDETSAALALLNEAVESEPSDEAYYLRGKLHWKLGNRSRAMSDYCKAVELNPESEARQALEMSTSIMNFYNKDIYNP
jgi:predicted negative regulator of RcsB-dependent stress response